MSTPLLPGSPGQADTSTPVDPTLAARLVDHVERVVVGKRSVVTLSVATLLAGGHLLLEDVPGVGKTVLARTLARTIDGQHTRIQGAPDLLPTDLTGAAVWRPREERFEFVAGPLFANIVVVDEANRMPPRTQAALLEAMEEGQVSVDGVTHALPQPSMILATQNPAEQHGVHPLPESQLDRFTAATSMGYPEAVDEVAIVASQLGADPLTTLPPLLDLHQLAGLQAGQLVEVEQRGEGGQRVGTQLARDDRHLVHGFRVSHRCCGGEPVQLGLRQGVDPVLFRRVLGGEDH